MSEEQAKKNYERAMRLEHEFKHYFTGNLRNFQPNCCIKSNRIYIPCRALTYLIGKWRFLAEFLNFASFFTNFLTQHEPLFSANLSS